MRYGRYRSQHACKRSQQRGISDSAIEAALYFGERFHDHDGSKAHFLSRKAAAKAERMYGVRLDEYVGATVIISDKGEVVTVQYCERPKRNWRGRH